ncbi:hypothetical protein GGR56DRAFT_618890 [Xylariaceae sp. FL0804]|nr:hypothetical protein GGR56DRAFT_618890 [Xylariaceae sp. FL0804]
MGISAESSSIPRSSNRFACLTVHDIGNHDEASFIPLVLATVHLTSGLTDDSAVTNRSELQSLLGYLLNTYSRNPGIMAGDFNVTTSASTIETALNEQAISRQTANYPEALEHMLSEAGLVDAWECHRAHFGDSSGFHEYQKLPNYGLGEGQC